MAKVVVTFKLEEEIYSKLKEIAGKEGRGVSEILRESLTDWLQNKKQVTTPDFIAFIKQQKNAARNWSEIASAVLDKYGISLDKEQLKSLSR
ncbi:MAG: ribbon-helix-helix domain-containing protein [Dehalococcoidia bacterium]|nr:ribbon-helix-helix domain-containing protein [Dehalococcoidia bacterium]